MSANQPDRLDLDRQVEVNAGLKATAEALLQTVQVHQLNFEMIVMSMQQMQSEIRGLQTENCRILDHLEGEKKSVKQDLLRYCWICWARQKLAIALSLC